jgi:hypothetical protein
MSDKTACGVGVELYMSGALKLDQACMIYRVYPAREADAARAQAHTAAAHRHSTLSKSPVPEGTVSHHSNTRAMQAKGSDGISRITGLMLLAYT